MQDRSEHLSAAALVVLEGKLLQMMNALAALQVLAAYHLLSEVEWRQKAVSVAVFEALQ